MSGFVVGGGIVGAPEALSIRTFQEDERVERFARRAKRERATELIIHESVCPDVPSTIAALKERNLGVHLIIAADGTLSQHADLVDDVLWHAGPIHNAASIGVEVVNVYYPGKLGGEIDARVTDARVIEAPWAHKGQYVLPKPAQAEAVTRLIAWITNTWTPGIEVPRTWVGFANGALQLGNVEAAATAVPGLLAHHYFDHADGAWLLLYAWLRLEAGLSAVAAFEQAASRATGVKNAADVSDLLPAATRLGVLEIA